MTVRVHVTAHASTESAIHGNFKLTLLSDGTTRSGRLATLNGVREGRRDGGRRDGGREGGREGERVSEGVTRTIPRVRQNLGSDR